MSPLFGRQVPFKWVTPQLFSARPMILFVPILRLGLSQDTESPSAFSNPYDTKSQYRNLGPKASTSEKDPPLPFFIPFVT
jgi:hypothetical protein